MQQPSTGTLVSTDAAFDFIGLGQPTASLSNLLTTSVKKNESMLELVRRLHLQARINIFGIRSHLGGLTAALAFNFDRQHGGHTMLKNNVSFINCGEGERYHPTQILLDLLAIVVWELFQKGIIKDGANAVSFQAFIKAVKKFCELAEKKRLEMIASAIDGKKICFAGDMNSRVLFDWLSVGRQDQDGNKKFDLRFILVAPQFAQVEGRYLQGIACDIEDKLHPSLPADIFYRLRWRKEDRASVFEKQIVEYDRQYRITKDFLDQLAKRDRPAYFFDALPIDKWNPSIDSDAQDHPNSLCWLQACCSKWLRSAVAKVCCEHWSDDETAAVSRWKLPDPAPGELIILEQESLTEHQRRYAKEKTGTESDAVRLQDTGCNLDHIPRVATLIERMLVASGLPSNVGIITKKNVRPRNGNGEPRDIMWFQGLQLHQWNPQLLDVINILTGGQMTYNVFDKPQDLFRKMKVGGSSRTIGVWRCPSGVNPSGLDPECIDGHPEEIKTVSIFDTFPMGNQHFGRCFYCGSLHTAEEMSNRLRRTLPDF